MSSSLALSGLFTLAAKTAPICARQGNVTRAPDARDLHWQHPGNHL